jgi:flagellar basal-body rod protein FlgC
MGFDDVLGVTNISASGMAAERMRMEVVANNIANASSTRTPNGGPYRRQDLVFAAVLGDSQRASSDGTPRMGGVQIVDMVEDKSEPIDVYEPGHPDADGNGMVKYPNVRLPIEMTNLITASRAYEANVRVATTLKQMMEQSLTLIRGGA